MPDFDIDFCETRRGEVIRYVQERYGHDKVAQIITFGKLKARAVLRDTGRILQMSYGHVDRLCKMVPNHPTDPWTLPRTLNGVAEFKREYDNDDEVKRLVDLAMQLEGFPRNSSTHAAGVVIGDRPLSQLVPLYRDPRSDMPVTQFDMKYVEDAGLVKFDFLGLKTLSVLRKAVDLLARRGIEIDLDALPWDDPAGLRAAPARRHGRRVPARIRRHAAHALGGEADTVRGHHRAGRALPARARWTTSRCSARARTGRSRSNIRIPSSKSILAETYGIFVYQEQVMQAAQVLAGYSLGDADLLRRAMGKKIQAEMDAQRQRFVDGCKEVSGIDARQGERAVRPDRQVRRLRLQQVPRGGLRAALLPDRLAEDALSGGILRRLDVLRHAPVGKAGGVRRRLAAQRLRAARAGHQPLRGRVHRRADRARPCGALCAGRASATSARRRWTQIVAEREARGPFESLEDLFRRMPPGAMNRRQLESLAGAGAFDSLEPNRAKVLANADMLLAVADAAVRERESGQAALFGGEDHAEPVAASGRGRAVEPRRADGGRARELRLLFRRASGRAISRDRLGQRRAAPTPA